MIPCTQMFKGKRTVHTDRTVGPLFVWNIASKCNLRCEHCYNKSDASWQGSELSDEKCIELVGEIAALRPPIVLLTGGEPLMRRNVFDIIRECKAKGLRVGLSTNGTLIDEEMAKKIASGKVDYVGISIDGREGLHDKMRALEGASAASWRAIEHLSALGIKTGVRFTLSERNKNDLFYAIGKAFSSGAKRFCLYHLVYTGRASSSMDMGALEKRELMNKFFGVVKDMASAGYDFDVLTTDSPADGPYMMGHILDEKALPGCMGPHGGCSAGERIFYLDSTGDVYPCQFLRDESLGNVTRSSIAEIWASNGNDYLTALRAKHDLLEGKCGRCAHKKSCSGCRARAKAVSGSLWAEDPACYLEESDITDAVMSTV